MFTLLVIIIHHYSNEHCLQCSYSEISISKPVSYSLLETFYCSILLYYLLTTRSLQNDDYDNNLLEIKHKTNNKSNLASHNVRVRVSFKYFSLCSASLHNFPKFEMFFIYIYAIIDIQCVVVSSRVSGITLNQTHDEDFNDLL